MAREGFKAFTGPRRRLEHLARAYGWNGSTEDLLARVAARLDTEVATMRRLAVEGDRVYVRMIDHGQDRSLQSARRGLDEI